MKKFGSTKEWLIFSLFLIVSIFNLKVSGQHEDDEHTKIIEVISWIAAIMLVGKISNLISPKIGIPPVVTMIISGMIVVKFAPPWVPKNQALGVLAELGLLFYLFKVGLESSIEKMRQAFKDSFWVATTGVIIPWILGIICSIAIFESGGFSKIIDGETGMLPNHLFFALTMCATSIGITMAIFAVLGRSNTLEQNITKGAAVFDDIIVLALASAIKSASITGEISLGIIFGQFFIAAGFFGLVIEGGRRFLPIMVELFSVLSKDHDQTRLVLLLIVCLFTAALAQPFGISPILGAFAGGLFLEKVHFKKLSTKIDEESGEPSQNERGRAGKTVSKVEDKTMEQLIEPIEHFLVPIFFVYTGMSMDVSVFADWNILLYSAIIGFLMIAGKVASGFFAPKANPWIIGFGMAPRGEVGLVLIVFGTNANLINEEQQAVALAVVIITTIISPTILSRIIKRSDAKALALGGAKQAA